LAGAAALGVAASVPMIVVPGSALAAGRRMNPDTPRALRSQKPPRGAVVLFNGKDLSKWEGRNGGEARWEIEKGGSVRVNGTGDIVTRQKFGDYRLHVEFNVPSMPDKMGQARGNSGVYNHGRYEVQVLDSYGPAIQPAGRPLEDNECGGIYKVAAPRVNATLPPGTWQTYDITFRGPRLKDGKVVEQPRITVVQNGVKIHDNVAVGGATTAGLGDPSEETGPILLQDHGNPVRYRNIWIVPVKKSP
jgi:hypothetical protein